MTVEKLGMLDHKEKGVSLVLLGELTVLVSGVVRTRVFSAVGLKEPKPPYQIKDEVCPGQDVQQGKCGLHF